MSNSSPMPVPIAVIIAWISVFESTLLMRFFSLLMIFPRRGRIAWYVRSRPVLAEPPAESPSTMYSSAAAGSRIEQSASLPGSEELSSADLRRVSSRALRAARRARIAAIAELRLRLPLELRVAELDRDDCGDALPDVLAVERLVLLEELELLRLCV